MLRRETWRRGRGRGLFVGSNTIGVSLVSVGLGGEGVGTALEGGPDAVVEAALFARGFKVRIRLEEFEHVGC